MFRFHVAFSKLELYIEPIALQLIRIAYRTDTYVLDLQCNMENSSFDIDNGDCLFESIEHNLRV